MNFRDKLLESHINGKIALAQLGVGQSVGQNDCDLRLLVMIGYLEILRIQGKHYIFRVGVYLREAGAGGVTFGVLGSGTTFRWDTSLRNCW